MNDGRTGRLPPLRDEIARAGLGALKALGQNFLLDPGLLAKIVRVAGVAPGDRVYEVGPGPGGLTRALLDAGAEIWAVECDARAWPILERLQQAGSGRLHLVRADALHFDAAAAVGAGAHIVANLPYNIGTLLLTGWLTDERWPPWWRSATLMFQKEVAARLVAGPGTAAYGRLSVLAQLRSEVRIAMRLPARAFVPAPKVDSAVVHIRPLPADPLVPVALVGRLTAAAFGQRRKMLRQSLKGVLGALAALERLGIDSARRAETLSVSDFSDLARALRSALACS